MDVLWLLILGVGVVVGGILWLRLHAFLALLLGAFVVGAATPADFLERFALERKMPPAAAKEFAEQSVGERLAAEFGQTCGKIGILIALAAVIGKCLLDSGAAERIVRAAIGWVGEARAPIAFLFCGFLLGIPVFFDTVFFLMIPLGKALRLRTGRNYALYVMSIVAGTTMAHSLVPPTPGPLYVAAELKVDLGHMILGGIVLGVLTVSAGYFYACWANRRWDIPLRDSPEMPLADLEKIAARDVSQLPKLWLALLPIILPVSLIAGNGLVKSMVAAGGNDMSGAANLLSITEVLGNPNIALGIAAAIALAMLAWQGREDRDGSMKGIQSALASGGLVILITASGGAFGGMLQQTGVGERIRDLAAEYQVAILPLAFLVTALVRTAQGSATVAMITTVGMIGPIAAPEALGFHPLYLALAIGCGSKPFPWMNDSGFWVIAKMSGLTIGETIKVFSCMVSLMALVGLAAIVVLARLFPLV